jgi:hypothetical protein
VAAEHYRQALADYRDRRFESANGQLRSFLEDLLIELAAKAGHQFKDPVGDVMWMRDKQLLTGVEWQLVRGLAGNPEFEEMEVSCPHLADGFA